VIILGERPESISAALKADQAPITQLGDIFAKTGFSLKWSQGGSNA